MVPAEFGLDITPALGDWWRSFCLFHPQALEDLRRRNIEVIPSSAMGCEAGGEPFTVRDLGVAASPSSPPRRYQANLAQTTGAYPAFTSTRRPACGISPTAAIPDLATRMALAPGSQ